MKRSNRTDEETGALATGEPRAAGTDRLEALLRLAGPGIRITPTEPGRSMRRPVAPDAAAPQPSPGQPEPSEALLSDFYTSESFATPVSPDPAPVAVQPGETPAPAVRDASPAPEGARDGARAPDGEIEAARALGRVRPRAVAAKPAAVLAHAAVPAAGPPAAAAVAPGRADPPPALEGLRHLPDGAVGRLRTLVEGTSQPPPMAVPAAQAAARAGGAPIVPSTRSELSSAVAASRRAFVATGLFSLVINILMLAGPLFMLQVYDRVMTSGSMPTLVVLSIMTAALYGVIGFLELVRTRVIVRIGVEIDNRLSDRIFRASLRRSISAPGSALPALRELDSLRGFISGPGPLTFFDAPWTPVYLLVVFMLHWTLGIAATIGAAMLLAIAWASESSSRGPLTQAGKSAAKSLEIAETGQRNAEAITAMGMLGTYRTRWQESNRQALAWQVLAADRLGTMSSLSKSLRLLLQSMMLAIGAALAIKGEISAGSIVAGTIIFGRALAPVEQAIGHWRALVKARESYAKLEGLLKQEPEPPVKTALPTPKGNLDVQSLRVAAPDTRQLILSSISFAVVPGQMLAVIGPSASGKSTLARTLVGLWPPFSGTVTLDGARLDQWSSDDLGRHIGYLPQDVELFAGTVKENIARFREGASDEDIVAAAKMAHAHELILALPQGYDSQLGAFGTYLSAGQRQRIGLARALYGNPALVVLDEPNSNLDRLGDEALSSAIDGMRARGQAVVLVSHRVQAIGKADLLLYLDRGIQRAFGPRNEVMRLFQSGGMASGGAGDAAARPAASRAQTAQTAAPAAATAGRAAGARPVSNPPTPQGE